MLNEILYLVVSLKTLLYYTLVDGNEKVYHIVFSSLKKFHEKMENVYLREILLEKLKVNILSIVVMTTIYNYCRIGIL